MTDIRPTLKAHKTPLKVRLIINTQGAAFYKIVKFINKEIKELTTSGKSFIKDSATFVGRIHEETIEKGEKNDRL